MVDSLQGKVENRIVTVTVTVTGDDCLYENLYLTPNDKYSYVPVWILYIAMTI